MRRSRQKQDGDLKYIETLNLRNVTYCKRKRGFLKKAMELSVLCGQKISLMIYDDRKNKLVTFCSDDFSHEKAGEIFKDHIKTKNKKLEVYGNSDYESLKTTAQIDDNNVKRYVLFNVEKPENQESENSNKNGGKQLKSDEHIEPLNYREIFNMSSEPPINNIDD